MFLFVFVKPDDETPTNETSSRCECVCNWEGRGEETPKHLLPLPMEGQKREQNEKERRKSFAILKGICCLYANIQHFISSFILPTLHGFLVSRVIQEQLKWGFGVFLSSSSSSSSSSSCSCRIFMKEFWWNGSRRGRRGSKMHSALSFLFLKQHMKLHLHQL